MVNFEDLGYAAGLAAYNTGDEPVRGGQLYNLAYDAVQTVQPTPQSGSDEWWQALMGFIHGYYDAIRDDRA